MKQHKWHKEIKAWADGEEIEVFELGSWGTLGNPHPHWYEDREYRIKPQPKEPKYLYVHLSETRGDYFLSENEYESKSYYIGKIKLEDETNE